MGVFKRRGKGANKNIIYYGAVRWVGGKQQRIRTGHGRAGKERAQKLSARWMEEHRLGIVPRFESQRPTLFKDRAEWTLENHYLGMRSYEWAKMVICKHLIPYFGMRNLASITADDVREYMAARLKMGRKNGTINRERAVLSNIMELARKAKLTPENPVRDVNPYEELETVDRWLTQDEADALVANAKGHLKALIIAGLETGARKNELVCAQRPRVNYESGFFEIPATNTKSGRSRYIPLTPRLVETLRGLPVAISGSGVGHLITCHGKKVGNIRWAFETARKRAGLGKDVTFHTLRRTFATWFMQNGGSVFVLKELLGHSDIKLTMRYAKHSPAHQKESVRYMGQNGAPTVHQTVTPSRSPRQ
ncbi:MAG: site-specific integrase [Acidobacteria bacterium]|nr:site-specific integrase [Acidobacteriota bacterium]